MLASPSEPPKKSKPLHRRPSLYILIITILFPAVLYLTLIYPAYREMSPIRTINNAGLAVNTKRAWPKWPNEVAAFIGAGIPEHAIAIDNMAHLFAGATPYDSNVMPAIGKLRHLQSLSISTYRNVHLPDDLSLNPDLKKLNIFGEHTNDRDAVVIAKCITLEKLNIFVAKITDKAAREMIKLPNLRILTLRHISTITDRGMTGLGHTSNLTSLTLASIPLTNLLADEIRNLNHLTHLELEELKITNEFFKRLGKIKSLQSISLYNLNIDQHGIRTLARNAPNLKTLEFDSKMIEDPLEIRRLAREFPHIKFN